MLARLGIPRRRGRPAIWRAGNGHADGVPHARAIRPHAGDLATGGEVATMTAQRVAPDNRASNESREKNRNFRKENLRWASYFARVIRLRGGFSLSTQAAVAASLSLPKAGKKRRMVMANDSRKQFFMEAEKVGIPYCLYSKDLQYNGGFKEKQIEDDGTEYPTVAVYLRNGSVLYCHSTDWNLGSRFIDLYLWDDFKSGKYFYEANSSCVSVRISEISHCCDCWLSEVPK